MEGKQPQSQKEGNDEQNDLGIVFKDIGLFTILTWNKNWGTNYNKAKIEKKKSTADIACVNNKYQCKRHKKIQIGSKVATMIIHLRRWE